MTHSDIDINYLIGITRSAAEAIMTVYAKDFSVDYKSDHSPVTDADRLANKIIIEKILDRYPTSNIISEENKQIPYEERKNWRSFWLIDPLDGTKEFIKKNGEFTVNIALIEDGVPTFGIVYAPVPDLLYYGMKGGGSYKITKGETVKIHNDISYLDKQNIKVIASRSHMSEQTRSFVADLQMKGKNVDFISAGSSIKLCLVADGSADVYPRYNPTMEWDTGAAHAVALYAGREVLNADTMQALIYNKPNLLNPNFIVQ